MPPDSLCDPVLITLGIEHGFAHEKAQLPDSTVFPRQVHGTAVLDVRAAGPGGAGEQVAAADVVVTAEAMGSIGIVTADCVPILVAALDGSAVAAIHAGWRGTAAGVIEAGLEALRSRAGSPDLVAAIGPAAGRCCYEVDQPVVEGLADRYAEHLDAVLVATRPDHFQLDLTGLARRILGQNGVEKRHIGLQNCRCTICSEPRLPSYRRDGAGAGRMTHFIRRPAATGGEG